LILKLIGRINLTLLHLDIETAMGISLTKLKFSIVTAFLVAITSTSSFKLTDHLASGLPLYVHLNTLAAVRLK
jgi:hypothetical protein